MSDYYKDFMSNLTAGKGEQWKPVAMSPLVNTWITPGKIKIDGNCLAWSDAWRGREVPAEDIAKLLPAFLELAEVEGDELAAAVLEYAQRWGALGLCHHQLPVSHALRINLSNEIGLLSCGHGCSFIPKDNWYVEPLERWQFYARQARAVLALAAQLRELKPDKTYNARCTARTWEQWKTALVDFPRLLKTISASGSDKVWHARMALSWAVNRWLGLAQLRPMIWWSVDEPSFRLQSATTPVPIGCYLFPALATQLTLIVNGSLDLAACSGCSQPFYLRKGQSLSKRSYCEDCGIRVARRDALTRHRERKRNDPDAPPLRKRPTAKQRETIKNARPMRGSTKTEFVEQLCSKYGLSGSTIYKIRQSTEKGKKNDKAKAKQ